jgi:hypothetical protein
LIAMIEKGVTPVIPEKGSVGASGDLAPLAHLALAAIGEGEVFYKGERLDAATALERAQIAPLQLESKKASRCSTERRRWAPSARWRFIVRNGLFDSLTSRAR